MGRENRFNRSVCFPEVGIVLYRFREKCDVRFCRFVFISFSPNEMQVFAWE